MSVLNLILVLPNGDVRTIGEAAKRGDEPWDVTLYCKVFETYLGEVLDKRDVAPLRVEFRPL